MLKVLIIVGALLGSVSAQADYHCSSQDKETVLYLVNETIPLFSFKKVPAVAVLKEESGIKTFTGDVMNMQTRVGVYDSYLLAGNEEEAPISVKVEKILQKPTFCGRGACEPVIFNPYSHEASLQLDGVSHVLNCVQAYN